MTVRLLTDWKDPDNGRQYFVGNLLTRDAATEAGLVALKQADTNLTGGTAWTAPLVPESIDEARSGSRYEVATLARDSNNNVTGLVDPATGLPMSHLGVSQASKTPSPSVGANLSLSHVTAVGGSPTITLTTGPDGRPAIKVVTGVGTNAEVTFPGLLDASYYGDAFVSMYGSRTLGNIDYVTWYWSQDDASYAKGGNTQIQYGLTAPQNGYLEQGGVNTYFFAKPKISAFGVPTYPAKIGANKLRIVPLAGTAATVYIYAVGIAAPANKARICVTWDDGYDSFFKLGYEAFASRGIKQTLSVIGSAQDTGGTYSYLRQLKAFVAAGNACVAHGPWPNSGAGNLFTAYPGSTDPVADAVADMIQNRQYLIDNGLLVANAEKCYVWPQGTFQQSVNDTTLLDAAIAAGFKIGRGTSPIATSTIYPGGTRFDAASKYNRMALPILGHSWAGTTAAEATNISNITTAISNMSTYRGDAFLMLHRVQPSSTADGSMSSIGIRVSDLETIAAAIKTEIDAGTMEAVTMPELYTDTEWSQ